MTHMETWVNVQHREDKRIGRVVDIDWANQTADILWAGDAEGGVETVGFRELTTVKENV
jgi:predicted metallo-beta-lactamase superfamily hydrolase